MRIETIGEATLILGDATAILPTLDLGDGAIVSDPPYGINHTHGPRRSGGFFPTRRGGLFRGERANIHTNIKIAGDAAPFDPTWMIEGYENVLIWGANHFYPRLPERGRWLGWNKLGAKASWDSFCGYRDGLA